jgi:hypothetical protein
MRWRSRILLDDLRAHGGARHRGGFGSSSAWVEVAPQRANVAPLQLEIRKRPAAGQKEPMRKILSPGDKAGKTPSTPVGG